MGVRFSEADVCNDIYAPINVNLTPAHLSV